MEVVVINRSTRKVGLMLTLLGLILLCPLLVYIPTPTTLSLNLHGLSNQQIFAGIFACLILIASVYFSWVIVKMLLSKTVALELSEHGIRYNPTGRAEQFIPIENIYGASLERTGDGGFSALLVLTKEGRAEYVNKPVTARILTTAPSMRIWHEFLDGSPEKIAQAINHYFNISKTAETPEIYELSKIDNAYIPVAIGSACIAFGFVIPFAPVPLWVGLSAALLIIVLGSIILSVNPNKLNVHDFPKHVAKVIRISVNTLIGAFTSPEPTVPKRVAGAILYPVVGMPTFYLILSYVLCNEMSCGKAYDISIGLAVPMLVTLLILGYVMGVGRKN